MRKHLAKFGEGLRLDDFRSPFLALRAYEMSGLRKKLTRVIIQEIINHLTHRLGVGQRPEKTCEDHMLANFTGGKPLSTSHTALGATLELEPVSSLPARAPSGAHLSWAGVDRAIFLHSLVFVSSTRI